MKICLEVISFNEWVERTIVTEAATISDIWYLLGEGKYIFYCEKVRDLMSLATNEMQHLKLLISKLKN